MIQSEAYIETSWTGASLCLDLVRGMDYLNYTSLVLNSYRPLISLKSMQSKTVRNFMPFVATTQSWERYVYMTWLVPPASLGPANENLTLGIIYFGTQEYPFGLYEVNMYANTSNTNLDPANALDIIYTGLLNVYPGTTQDYPKYSEYDENDTDTNSIYITA